MTASMEANGLKSNVSLAVALVTAPSSAFEELRERPRFWFPLLILVASTVAIVYWYYSMVDIEWLKDAMYANNPDFQKLPEAERAAAMAALGRNTLLWGSVVSIIFVLPIFLLLQASYLRLAAKITKLPQGFKHWFALTCWSGLPVLLSTVVAALLLIISDTPQVSPSVMQPFSINELVLHRPMGSPGHALLESLSIPGLLSWALLVIGVRAWSRRSWTFSVLFILVPIVVIYGTWSVFAFR
jgi:hypothetical protein